MILAKFSSAKRRDVRSRVDVSLARIREVRVSHGFVGRFAARRRRESRRVLAGAGRVCRSGAAGGSRRAARVARLGARVAHGIPAVTITCAKARVQERVLYTAVAFVQ